MLDREELKAEATELGIEFPSNVKNDKLERLINEAKNGEIIMPEKTEATVVPEKVFLVLPTQEYEDMSKANGTTYGRKDGEETKCSIEELRVLINSNWTPEMVMSKHGMSEETHKQLVWELSTAERRDKPIAFTKTAYRKG